MCHSRKMQKQIYLLEDKRKNAVATSQQLKYVLKERERERIWPGRPSQCITTDVWRGIADGKITVTLVKAKSLQISSFYDMTDLQICDKVPSINKVKIGSGNITQDEEELLLGN